MLGFRLRHWNTLIEWGCGQFAGALRTLSHGVMGGTVMQGYRVEIYIQHPSSPFTLQKQKKTLKKIEADKHPPWDWKLRAAAAGILTAILASRSLEHSLSFSGGDRDPANSPTNCVGLTFPIALCNNNHCVVISPRCHQWFMAWQSQGDRNKSEFRRKQQTHSRLICHRTSQR